MTRFVDAPGYESNVGVYILLSGRLQFSILIPIYPIALSLNWVLSLFISFNISIHTTTALFHLHIRYKQRQPHILSKWVPSLPVYGIPHPITTNTIPRLTCTEQITGVFHSIGACLKGIVSTIGSIIMAIVNGVVSLCNVLITCVTCGYCGGGRRTTKRSRI